MEAKQIKDLMEAYVSVYNQSEAEVISEDLQGAVERGLDAAAKNPVIKAIGKVIAPVGKGRGTVTKAEQEKNIAKEEVEVIDEKIATGTGKKVMPSAEERSALAKKARAGKDIGKPGKGFEKVAEKAAKQYGSEEAGKRVAAAAMFKAQAKEEVETDLFDFILEYLVAEGYADTNQAALAIMANMSEEWKQSIVEQTARIDYVQDKFNRENEAKSGSALTAIPGKQNTGQALQKARESARQMGKLGGV